MLGLELGDEISPFQIFLQFLKEERKKNIFEELKYISQISESNKPRNQRDSKSQHSAMFHLKTIL